MKKIVALLMAIIMLVFTPMEMIASEISNSPRTTEVFAESLLEEGNEEYITRIQWLQTLINAYGMSVEEDNYADNYYKDVEQADQYYRDIMIAIEFGLIDVEAGDSVYPNDPATREFVAYTLNACMGYSPQEESYTFNESDKVRHPDDIQAAIDSGWFSLDETGNFIPEEEITYAEFQTLSSIAQTDADERKIDLNHLNSYKLQSDVILIPDYVEVEMVEDEIYTLSEPLNIFAVGDKIAFLCFDFPIVKRVTAISTIGGTTTLSTESIDTEEAFVSIDYQGVADGNLADIKVENEENVALTYVVGGTKENKYEDGIEYDNVEIITEEVSAVKITKSYDISDKTAAEFDIAEGFKLEVYYTISNPTYDFKINTENPYINFNATVDIGCNATAELVEAVGADADITLASIPFAGVGFLKVKLTFSASGEINLELTQDISMGVKYSEASGLQVTRSFTKRAFTINAKIESSIGLQASIGFDVVVIEGELYAEVGATTFVDQKQYTDGNTPKSCTHITGHLYAEIAAQIEVGLGEIKLTHKISHDIYDETNSPVKIAFHFEDGKQVYECTRDPEAYKYFSSKNSKYKRIISAVIYDYEVLEDGTAHLWYYGGNQPKVVIPRELAGYEVSRVSGFQNLKGIKVVTIPDTVRVIDDYAFTNCEDLHTVFMSSNVERIGNHAFAGTALTAINLPESLTEIGVAAFEGTNITSVVIPSGIKCVNSAFINCKYLRAVNLPEGIESVDGFGGCTSLSGIVLPSSVKYINNGAFRGCTSLSRIVLPSSVKYIGNGAFNGCTSLRIINIPASVNQTEADTFNAPFENCPNLRTIILEDGMEVIPGGLFKGCKNISNFTIPETVTKIGPFAFAESNIEEANLPSGLTELGCGAFYKCDKLKKVTIPNTLNIVNCYDSIYQQGNEDYAAGPFLECSSLETVIFEEGITTIPNTLFLNSEGATNVTIPSTVKMIESNAFKGNTRLTKVITSDKQKLQEIGKNAFTDCENLKEISLANSLNTIGAEAFSGCKKLEALYLSRNVSFIGQNVFDNCILLTIQCVKDTVAHNYAQRYGVNCDVVEYPVTELLFSEPNIELKQQDRLVLNYETTPTLHTDKIEWSSSDTSMASVEIDEYGNVYVCAYSKLGTVTITATAESGVSASCKITVVPNTHMITYVLNGGINSSDNPSTFGITETVMLKEPTRNGYTFNGWYTNAECSGTNNQVYKISSGTNKDITLYAGWTINRYDIYYGNLNAGGINHVDNPNSYTVEDKDIVLKDATWTGYRFLGWYEAGYDGAAQVTTIDTSLAKPVSVHAKWLPNVYTIIYDGNGATSGNMAPIEVEYEEYVIILENEYVRNGYTFTGWNTKADGSGTIYGVGYNVSNLCSAHGESVTLYAQWEKLPGGYTDVVIEEITLSSTEIVVDESTGTSQIIVTIKASGIDNYNDYFIVRYSNSYRSFTNNVFRKADGVYEGIINIDYYMISDEYYTLENVYLNNIELPYSGVSTFKVIEKAVEEPETEPDTEPEIKKEWKVTFDVNGGKSLGVSGTRIVEEDQKVGALPKPSRTGYSFVEWNTKKDGTGSKISADTKISKDIVFYAKWKELEYSITYNVNGGKLSSNAVKKFTVTTNTFNLPKPTKTGYTFAGWYLDKECKKTKVTQITKGTTGSKNYYAKWIVNKYNIKFNANGGTGTVAEKKNVKYTSKVVLTNKFTRKGYTFTGWAKSKGGDVAYKNKQEVSKLTSTNGKTVTLYAQWKKTKYKVTYELNGGKNNKSNPESYYITTATKKLKNPTRKGYTFKGWYSDSKYKKKVTEIKKGSTGNKTLYAKWQKKKYTITYELKGGKNNKNNPKTYYVTTATKKLQKPTRKGYTFKGWYSDAKYKNKVTQIKKGSTGNIKLYAKWSKKK